MAWVCLVPPSITRCCKRPETEGRESMSEPSWLDFRFRRCVWHHTGPWSQPSTVTAAGLHGLLICWWAPTGCDQLLQDSWGWCVGNRVSVRCHSRVAFVERVRRETEERCASGGMVQSVWPRSIVTNRYGMTRLPRPWIFRSARPIRPLVNRANRHDSPASRLPGDRPGNDRRA